VEVGGCQGGDGFGGLADGDSRPIGGDGDLILGLRFGWGSRGLSK
jgi:hypothetical protein